MTTITNPAPGLGQSCRSQSIGTCIDERPVGGRVRALIVLKHPGTSVRYFLNPAEFAHVGSYLLRDGWEVVQ